MVVIIGGASQSGKTTLAEKLIARHATCPAIHLSQDDFVVPRKEMPQVRGLADWEHPGSIDWHRFLRRIDGAAHDYDLVIAEGHVVFGQPEVLLRADLKIFIDVDFGTFVRRRREEKRWGFEPAWYLDHVWRSYLLHGGRPTDPQDVLILSGLHPFDTRPIVRQMLLIDPTLHQGLVLEAEGKAG